MKNLAIDIGNTIASRGLLFPNSLETIKKLNPIFNNVYIVSRVNSEQRERALKWFEDIDFFNKTLIKPKNVYFCFDRRDKAVFCRGLFVDVMIDDRPDVMQYLDIQTMKILFKPNKDLELIDKLFNCFIVSDWLDIATYFGV